MVLSLFSRLTTYLDLVGISVLLKTLFQCVILSPAHRPRGTPVGVHKKLAIHT